MEEDTGPISFKDILAEQEQLDMYVQISTQCSIRVLLSVLKHLCIFPSLHDVTHRIFQQRGWM